MREVLISIQPKWCKLICSGEKTVEVRKNRPNCELPFKCYIYCTKGKPTFSQSAFCDDVSNRKVIGEFVCNRIDDFYCASVPYVIKNNLGYGKFIDNGVYKVQGNHEGIVFERNDRYIDTMLKNADLENMCLSAQEIFDYIGLGKHLYAWHISDLVIYDKPRELRDFQLPCDHENDCGTCKRAIYCSSTRRFCRCNLEDGLKRPPQSYCYIATEPRQTADTVE